MPPFISLFLFFVIFVCALWFHNVWFPPEGRAYKKKQKHNHRTRTSLPDVGLQEVGADAMERWLDDGGASDHEAVYDARGVSPLQFLKP